MKNLREVDFLHDDVLENGYRSCDFCYGSATDDIFDGLPPRKFYHATDGSELTVCENCVETFLASEEQDSMK